jgi:hypothetical protein
MPGNYSREKGAGAERELAKLLSAEKVSGMYRPGPDLHWEGYPVEVKRRAQPISKRIWMLLQDTPILMERADRDDWYVHLSLSTLLDLKDQWAGNE